MDAVDRLEAERPKRAPLTVEQIEHLKAHVARKRSEVRGRGHELDVADIMEAVIDFNAIEAL